MITDELQSIIAAEVSRQVRASRMNDGSGPLRVDPFNIPFQNVSGEVVPPYAVMRPDDGEVRSGNWVSKWSNPMIRSRADTLSTGRMRSRRRFRELSPTEHIRRWFASLAREPTSIGNLISASNPVRGISKRRRRPSSVITSARTMGKEPEYLAAFRSFSNTIATLIVQATSTVTPGDYTVFNVHDIDGETFRSTRVALSTLLESAATAATTLRRLLVDVAG